MLWTEDILRNEKTNDPNSIISLSFSHKALSHVSCLSDFKNLEKLDLSFNCLTSLKGLGSCVNLKWLSVHQNKLLSLEGIEALTNLTVLNAGRNNLSSMDGVKNLVKLCALILNDNEIASISGLDQLIELNTLVLSRNPICKVGVSLAKLKSIVKISLSSCHLEDIDSSFKACTGLEQLRLAHNNIKTLPAVLAYNKKLQILDLGNNMISRWSDLEVLSSLSNLRNLNLLGNPIAEKVKLLKKVKKLAPSLQILDSKRMDRLSSETNEKVENAVGSGIQELEPLKQKKKDHNVKKWDVGPNYAIGVDFDGHVNQKGLSINHKLVKDRGLDEDTCYRGKEKSGMKTKAVEDNAKIIIGKEYQLGKKQERMKKENSTRKAEISQRTEGNPDVAQIYGDSKAKKQREKKEKESKKEVPLQEACKAMIKDKSLKRKVEKEHLDVIDDKETPFFELVGYYDATESKKTNNNSQAVGNFDAINTLVTYPAKRKKSKNQGAGASALQFPILNVGLGGSSAWSDSEK